MIRNINYIPHKSKGGLLDNIVGPVALPAPKRGLLDRIFDHVVLPAPDINRDKLVDRIFGYIAISFGA